MLLCRRAAEDCKSFRPSYQRMKVRMDQTEKRVWESMRMAHSFSMIYLESERNDFCRKPAFLKVVCICGILELSWIATCCYTADTLWVQPLTPSLPRTTVACIHNTSGRFLVWLADATGSIVNTALLSCLYICRYLNSIKKGVLELILWKPWILDMSPLSAGLMYLNRALILSGMCFHNSNTAF